MGLATDIIFLIIAAFFCGLLFQRIGQPLILGYLAAGILLGPHTGGVTVSNIHEIELLSVGLPILGFAALKALAFIIAMVLLGTRLLPQLMSHIAKLGSRELFLLAITAIGLGVGYATYIIGLSFAFGAFVAGMVLSESDYGHQALSDIVPLRDLFGLLFFTSVGMLLDPKFLFDHMRQVVFLVLAVSIGKGFIFATISRIFKYRNVIPLAVGLGLFQIGEFSFVLARVGLNTNSIDADLTL
jgi:monovalent cation:H+ antiporter-2, CPA2 family